MLDSVVESLTVMQASQCIHLVAGQQIQLVAEDLHQPGEHLVFTANLVHPLDDQHRGDIAGAEDRQDQPAAGGGRQVATDPVFRARTCQQVLVVSDGHRDRQGLEPVAHEHLFLQITRINPVILTEIGNCQETEALRLHVQAQRIDQRRRESVCLALASERHDRIEVADQQWIGTVLTAWLGVMACHVGIGSVLLV